MKKALILTALVLVCLCVVATPAFASAPNNGLRQLGQGQHAYLTAEWWQWILEQPAAGNPILDTTGVDAANGQPGGGVFFLAGSFGGAVTRTFSVPSNTALFLPLLNNVALAALPAPQPKPGVNQVPQLRTLLAAPLVDGATGLHVTLDGVSLLGSAVRVKSPVFHFTSPADGFFGLATFTAVSDGYWLYLAPPAPGPHVLNFGGASGTFAVDVTDIITVE